MSSKLKYGFQGNRVPCNRFENKHQNYGSGTRYVAQGKSKDDFINQIAQSSTAQPYDFPYIKGKRGIDEICPYKLNQTSKDRAYIDCLAKTHILKW